LQNKARSFRRTVGWPHGRRQVNVWWQEQHRFWVALSPNINPNHYWVAFGLQNPEKHKVMNITCEVNPSRRVNARRSAGLLLKDLNGSVFLGHSGRVGGGKTGVGKTAFLNFHRGKTQPMAWNTGNKARFAKVLVFGKIGASALLGELGRFVVDVDNFKQGISGDKNSTDDLLKIEAAALENLGVSTRKIPLMPDKRFSQVLSPDVEILQIYTIHFTVAACCAKWPIKWKPKRTCIKLAVQLYSSGEHVPYSVRTLRGCGRSSFRA
jgi:hypothetical protein